MDSQPEKTSALAALRYRNYRLLWIGLIISMAGSMMRQAAILWQVSLLAAPAEKALALGVVGLVRVIPIIVFSFISGVVADAVDRRRLMVLTNAGMGVVSAVLAVITFSGHITLGWLYLLAALSAAIGSFDGPARQSLFPTLVPREHLPNAISLNSIMFQVASVTGPMLGGVVIAAGGVGWAYALDAASFVALITSLLLMRDLPARPPEQRAEVSLRAGLDGLRFVFSQPLIRASMLLDFFATFFASATTLLPIFAQDVLKVGVQGYGVLSAAPAVGAMLTSLAMVPLVERIVQRGRVLVLAVGLYGLATVVFGLSATFWLTFACLFVTGAADMVSTVLRNIIRQLVTPDGMRGRMTSVNMIFFMGGPQLGELEAGLVAQAFGPALSVITGGLGCILATALIVWQTPGLLAYRKEAPPGPALQAAD
ncbi:MAG: MFS transporter [Anaerolineales bacterium]|nr:MFS transporter [Anaerolineales bacterium]